MNIIKKRFINYDKFFINIKLNKNTLLVYTVRKYLQKSLDKNINKFRGVLVDLGCGEQPYKQYILDNNPNVKKYICVDINFNTIHQSVKPDIYWDGKKIPIKSNTVDTVISTEFFEHISNIEVVLKEIHRILKKGGVLFFTVPFIWPLHEVPYDQYRYTPYSLTRHFNNSKFLKIEILPMSGHNAALAQMLCIWLYKSQILQNNSFINLFFFLLINKLIQKDESITFNEYSNNSIPIGFYGVVYK
jgi:ubiquinone/menaquinone biosynthesis C-methylase UbiE